MEATTNIEGMPVACGLSADRLGERKEEISGDIWVGVEEKQELENGYAFRFPGTDMWADRLYNFVRFERKCCRFFVFTLEFEPDEGTIWLRLEGGPGTKEFIESMG